MTKEIVIDTTQLDENAWLEFPDFGFRQYFLWKNEDTGASIAVLDFEEGGRIPTKHAHASNQFMFCISGEYEYTDSDIVLGPGTFYSNPKDNPHGPTLARKRSLLIEIYDGPHYYEKPSFHTDETIGGHLVQEEDGNEG